MEAGHKRSMWCLCENDRRDTRNQRFLWRIVLAPVLGGSGMSICEQIIRAVAFALVIFVRAGTANGAPVDDFEAYLAHFEHIESLAIESHYHKSMTAQMSEVDFANLLSEGTYRYWYDSGRYRVESELVAKDDLSQGIASRGTYVYDGEQWHLEDRIAGVREVYGMEPLVGVTLPTNPLLMGLAFLRLDLPGGTLIGLEHFASNEAVLEKIQSIDQETDERGRVSLNIGMVDGLREGQPKEIYRLMMRDFPDSGSSRLLPAVLSIGDDSGNEIARIETERYQRVQINQQEMYLPRVVRFLVYQGDEATVEYVSHIDRYAVGPFPDSVFSLAEPDQKIQQIELGGTMLGSDGQSA